MSGDSFQFDTALEHALGQEPVPALPADFADRLIDATQNRTAPLPQARPAPKTRWRSGRRLVVGVFAVGALATGAGAAGLLDDLPIDIPTAQEVWSVIIGREPEQQANPSPSAPAMQRPISGDLEPGKSERVEIEGPIDTPEELEEAFSRVDKVRGTRRDNRREAVDRSIDRRLERAAQRRANRGLPAPTAEQEERLRARIERVRERADGRREERTQERRDEMREIIENGGELTREDLRRQYRGLGSETPFADRLEELRNLPPEERRARIRQWRERRQDRLGADEGVVEQADDSSNIDGDPPDQTDQPVPNNRPDLAEPDQF